MIVSWVTVIWLMIASACLTLAGMYFLVWFRNRGERAHLFFALNAISMAAFACGELWMMRVATPDEAVVAFRFAHVGLVGWLLSTVWFVKTYLRAGRAWLAWTILAVRLGVMPFNFLPGQNLDLPSDHPSRARPALWRNGRHPEGRRQSVAGGHANRGDTDHGVHRRCEHHGMAPRRPA